MKRSVLIGAAALLAGGLSLVWLGFLSDGTSPPPRLLAAKWVEKAGIHIPWVVAMLAPEPRYLERPFEGRIRSTHPRVLVPDPLALSAHRDVALAGCGAGDVLNAMVCWLAKRDDMRYQALLRALAATIQRHADAKTDITGTAWELALAYDIAQIPTAPAMPRQLREELAWQIERALRRTLDELDGSGPSLWHSRTSMAASAWISAVALGPEGLRDKSLLNRAQGHFQDTLRALSLSEAWPEGYTYWINSRAFTVLLAASAWLNGLETNPGHAEVRRIVERVGLWHIYATRPDNRAEALGDENSRVDLKDETRRVIDLIGQLTGNPVFATYSAYLEKLHGSESYWSGYRWGLPLIGNPVAPKVPGVAPGDLKGIEVRLPRSERFGHEASGLVYARTGWGGDDTFISYRAGKVMTHHGHYDAGHFTLFKGGPLAIASGTYGEYFQRHRLDYSIRSVAKNTLLVMRPGEIVRPNDFFSNNVADGGQRVVIPTGSAVQNVDDWLANQGRGLHFEAGAIIDYEHAPGRFTYVASDLTDAYNTPRHDSGGQGGKVTRVMREWVHLADEDRLLIHDDVASVQAGYVKKWLLHTVNKPQAEGLVPRKGTVDNGILETRSDSVRVSAARGRLLVRRLLPEDGVIRLLGGPDYRFYVETDGDDAVLDGANMTEGIRDQPWFDAGSWRMEMQPVRPGVRDHFLVALSPSLDRFRDDEVSRLKLKGAAYGARTPGKLVIFLDRVARTEIEFTHDGPQDQLLLLGGIRRATAELSWPGGSRSAIFGPGGVARFDLAGVPRCTARIRW